MSEAELLKKLPPIHELLEEESGEELCEEFGRETVKRRLNQHLEQLRAKIQDAQTGDDGHTLRDKLKPDQILHSVKQTLRQSLQPSIVPVVNGTGVVLHTGLGRAVIGEDVLEHVKKVNRGYSLLAVERDQKDRVRREHGAADMICEITGAEAATVVNNNAAAVFLVLAAFARDQEVIISRGELVEIGGSFRVPDVMQESGAHLVEVGTTNKTHLKDYRRAITEDTSMLMKVHTSNYRIVGFHKDVKMTELSELAHEKELLAVEDLGSGALIDMSRFGLMREPEAKSCIDSGADLVCFSCDKLLGGPQAGVVAGSKDLVDQVRNHPLFRAVRLDKLILSALEKTLHYYLRPGAAIENVPALRMLSREEEDLKSEAEDISEIVQSLEGYESTVVAGNSRVGGGSLPGEKLPTHLVQIQPDFMPSHRFALALRLQNPPVFGRVIDDSFHVDPRTLIGGDQKRLEEALETCFHQQNGSNNT